MADPVHRKTPSLEDTEWMNLQQQLKAACDSADGSYKKSGVAHVCSTDHGRMEVKTVGGEEKVEVRQGGLTAETTEVFGQVYADDVRQPRIRHDPQTGLIRFSGADSKHQLSLHNDDDGGY